MNRLLLPAAWAYGALAAVRRGAYRHGYLPVGSVPVPVISVGAILAGGSGKTPVAGWLADFLLRKKLRVAVVHGGYGGRETRRVHRIDPAWRWQPGAAARFGDEALLLAGWCPGAMLFCGRDKLAASRRAAEAGAQVIVLDDGFQHRRLHRDVDLLLDDGAPLIPFPAGYAREGASAALDAHLRWAHGRDGELPGADAPLASRSVPGALHGLDGVQAGVAADLNGRRVFLLAGIARPEAFERMVRRLGAHVVGHAWARDHAIFSPRQLREAARSRAEVLVCTEKDAVRLAGVAVPTRDLLYLSCRVELTRGLGVLERRMEQLGAGRGWACCC